MWYNDLARTNPKLFRHLLPRWLSDAAKLEMQIEAELGRGDDKYWEEIKRLHMGEEMSEAQWEACLQGKVWSLCEPSIGT